MNDQINLGRLRGMADMIVSALMWIHLPIILTICLVMGRPSIASTLSAAACALVSQGFIRARPDTVATRAVTGVCLMISVSLIVAAFQGNKLQTDMHMYYFAALAVLLATCDWRAIAAAAATVAVHHIALNFLLPELIYPSGSDVVRLALHAVVLLAEAAALIWISFMLERMFVSLQANMERIEAVRLETEASVKRRMDEVAAKAEAIRTRSDDARALAARASSQVVATLADGLEKLSDGDLTFRIDETFAGDYEKLRTDFNATMGRLQKTMKTIVGRTQDLHASGEEISRASDNLSTRTEQQASSLEETAAALNQITATVQKTAEGAMQTQRVVASAKSDAERSETVVRDAVGAMTRIEESSRQIGQIIGVIDEIAFQTNLLALNAGVEAARAGDAGRGFAVVASEVRALAQRSAEAAKEIKTLISASSDQVAQGVDLVRGAGDALARIAGQIAEINSVVSNIATSAQDQATGLHQINSAMNQMDQVTQQNVAMVEQTTASAHSLRGEADALSDLVTQFRVGPTAISATPTQTSAQTSARAA